MDRAARIYSRWQRLRQLRKFPKSLRSGRPFPKQAVPRRVTEKVKAATKDRFWFVSHALLIVGCAVLYYLVGSKLIPVPQNTVDLARRFLRGAVLIVIVLAIAKAISIYAIGRLDDAATRFTLRRIEHLLVVLIIAIIVIGVIFVNWYTALISALALSSLAWPCRHQ
jgi:hypothetical protein